MDYSAEMSYPYAAGDFGMDHVLATLAEQYKGKGGDAGVGFGMRDISFLFKSEERAEEFVAAAKAKFKRVKGFVIQWGA